MKNKKYVIYAVVFLVLAVLVYLQFRTWQNFDWNAFLKQTGQVSKTRILLAIGWIYLAYVLRAVRWNIFLRPVRRASAARLISPTIVGFTGLALLGRAGEMIRPYLIARKENLTLASQIAIWAVERIFDLFSFALFLFSAIAFFPATRMLLHFFRVGSLTTIALGLSAVVFGILMVLKGDQLVIMMARRLSPKALYVGERVALRIREFREGLNAIQDGWAFLYAVFVSVSMWLMIGVSYWEVLHSYGKGPLEIPFSQVPLLMLSSMVGSLVALPGVGGGSQLATIFTLRRVFNTPQELAASCGILLWLVTFASVIPVGLILAHRERLSLRALSEETAKVDEGSEIETKP
jgi:glycosyltransferase 2 family protein